MALPECDDVLSLGTVSPTSSMSDIAADEQAAGAARPSNATQATRHIPYYFDDECITLEADNTIFRVHSYLFIRESDEGRALVKRARQAEGHIVVEDAKADDLERFCDVLYCRYSSPSPLNTKEEWTSVLHLSHRWSFATMRSLAIHKLSALTSPVDRVVLAHVYSVDSWLLPAYQAICECDQWLSDEEGRRLGIENVLKIGRARHAMRGIILVGGEEANRTVIVRDIFAITHDDHEDSTTPFDLVPAPVSGEGIAHPRHVTSISTDDASTLSDNGPTTLVIPAHVLPSRSRDLTLSSLPAEFYGLVEDAISAVKNAQLRASHMVTTIRPLEAEARGLVVRHKKQPIPSKAQRKLVTLAQSRLPLYEELIKTTEAQVKSAQATLLSLLPPAPPC